MSGVSRDTTSVHKHENTSLERGSGTGAFSWVVPWSWGGATKSTLSSPVVGTLSGLAHSSRIVKRMLLYLRQYNMPPLTPSAGAELDFIASTLLPYEYATQVDLTPDTSCVYTLPEHEHHTGVGWCQETCADA